MWWECVSIFSCSHLRGVSVQYGLPWCSVSQSCSGFPLWSVGTNRLFEFMAEAGLLSHGSPHCIHGSSITFKPTESLRELLRFSVRKGSKPPLSSSCLGSAGTRAAVRVLAGQRRAEDDVCSAKSSASPDQLEGYVWKGAFVSPSQCHCGGYRRFLRSIWLHSCHTDCWSEQTQARL